jgi:purine nucleosidase
VGRAGRQRARRRAPVALLLVALHFPLERRRRVLVATRLGEPLAGAPLPPRAAPSPDTPERVWVDTDAGCGLGARVDVDDCYAIAAVLASPELDVRGVGTVFGNVPLAAADSATRALLAVAERALPVYRGAVAPGVARTEAAAALARELAAGPLTVLAFGPATNLAAALAAAPGLACRVREVVFVAGKRPGQWMHPGYDHLVTFSDFNVARDPRAVASVLASGAPVTLVPFEAALDVVLTPARLDSVAHAGPVGRWLRARSHGWLAFWRREGGREGFVPFDGAAVVYLLRPALFRCTAAAPALERSPPWFGIGRPVELVVRPARAGAPTVRYCVGRGAPLTEALMERLLSPQMLAPRR